MLEVTFACYVDENLTSQFLPSKCCLRFEVSNTNGNTIRNYVTILVVATKFDNGGSCFRPLCKTDLWHQLHLHLQSPSRKVLVIRFGDVFQIALPSLKQPVTASMTGTIWSERSRPQNQTFADWTLSRENYWTSWVSNPWNLLPQLIFYWPRRRQWQGTLKCY